MFITIARSERELEVETHFLEKLLLRYKIKFVGKEYWKLNSLLRKKRPLHVHRQARFSLHTLPIEAKLVHIIFDERDRWALTCYEKEQDKSWEKIINYR